MTLRALAIAGARWTSLASAVAIGLSFVQLAMLARLLSPGDFGLMAIVLSISAFLQIMADAGASQAIIHQREVTEAQLSTLYWINVICGAALGALLAGASSWLASIYGEPRLQPLLVVAGLHLFVGTLWQQLRVIAQKELQFAPLAAIEICAAVVSLASALTVAWLGGGVYALAAGLLASSVAGAVLGWVLLPAGWRPGLVLRISEVRSFLRYGAYAMGNDLANGIASQLDILIGGRFLGPQATGLYSVSRNVCLQLAATINPVITRVALPLMAKAQHDRELLRAVYLRTLRFTASANFPAYVALGVLADEIVAVVLGRQWEAAAPLLRVLALWGLMRSTVNPVGSLLMACGKPERNFAWNAAWLLALPGTIWLAAAHGALGLAVGVTALGAIGWLLPAWYFLVRPLTGITLAEYAQELTMPFALALLAGAAAHVAASMLEHDALRLAAGLACCAIVYVAMSLRFNRIWTEAMRDLLGLGARA
jgi:lipopolysaccharide exporter